MKNNPILLGVNIDHVATLRQARKTRYPDPVEAVFAVENGGADGITIHLREDRRHQIEAAIRCDAPVIEIHTGVYADATTLEERTKELRRITKAVHFAHQAGLVVNAGHGLNYQNVQAIASIPEINELNIGHGIIARSIFMGLEPAVREMKRLMLEAR